MKKFMLAIAVLVFMAVQAHAAVTVIIKNNDVEMSNFDLSNAVSNQIRRDIKNQYGNVNSSSITDFMQKQFDYMGSTSKYRNDEKYRIDNADDLSDAANSYP